MSLSRLSPRSTRKGMSHAAKVRSGATPGARHLRLWDAVQRTRDELDQWQRQLEQVSHLFSQYIVPREKNLTEAVATITEQLIQYFSQRNLDTPDQSLLGLWITENLQSLYGHPFACHSHVQLLANEWKSIINGEGAIEDQLSRLARGLMDHEPANHQSHEQSCESANGSQRSDQDSADTCQKNESDPGRSSSNSQSAEQNTGTESDSKSKSGTADTNSSLGQSITGLDERVSILEKKLSVDRLFRQLAKALHPDKEQDESKRAEKHELMSQCLRARKNKDINTLLNLYCEHLGDLPDDLNDNSHSELIAALEEQLKQLQSKLREERFGNPLHAMIVERYASPCSEECQRRIDDHALSLDSEISALQRLGRQLKTHTGLLDGLDERRAVEQDRMAIDELTGAFTQS